MGKTLRNVTDFICHTPLIELSNTWDGNLQKGRLFGKMEFIQPGCSVKGLAVVCGAMKNPFIATMSEGNSIERVKILKALGAEVVRVPQADGSPGMVTGQDSAKAVAKALEIAKERNAFYVDQFNNPANVTGHYLTTGPEIWNDLDGNIDAFVASVGTGATFVGTSRFLKEKRKNIFCAPAEPEQAAMIKRGFVDNPKHIIQGTGYSMIPPQWDPALVDDIITVTDEEVEKQTRQLARVEGLYVGYSSGANVCAALKLLKSGILKGNPVVVTVLCDTAYKYSTL
ncbi:MAG: cysteine synthase family protein [Acidobacteria bacterium]|nr:cysteine synthase family protein [Acidobacteriota bacterium]